ncbi:MAG: hypothetical protein CSB48_05070 [Proteobacteria bacterium]|nr:MAG: hypothetical protein CSB48_05070 [Pseudomonadota bacterium]PIE40271.1 MAG: hypothetical protein CSA51_01690 [Gammaproteobacteria bacterium]
MHDPYVYPGTRVLKNKLGIKNLAGLREAEENFVSIRIMEIEKTPIKGSFDYSHLKAIHKYIFQDVYSWAGKPRTIGISKAQSILGGRSVDYPHPNSAFDNLQARADYVFGELKKDNYLKGMDELTFERRMVHHASEIWETHPFREGNTRTTVVFIRQCAKEAGYPLSSHPFGDSENTRDAFVLATAGKPENLASIISNARKLSQLRSIAEYCCKVKNMTGGLKQRFVDSVMDEAYSKFDKGESIPVPSKHSFVKSVDPDLEI